MNLPPETLSFLTALGVGFLIGIVRERLHQPGAMMAGVRTHTVAAIMGAVAFSLGSSIFGVALVTTGLSFISGGSSYGLKMTGALSLFVFATALGIAFT
jgi:uncharacterized membrane protein YhiD involved in acid resistance